MLSRSKIQASTWRKSGPAVSFFSDGEAAIARRWAKPDCVASAWSTRGNQYPLTSLKSQTRQSNGIERSRRCKPAEGGREPAKKLMAAPAGTSRPRRNPPEFSNSRTKPPAANWPAATMRRPRPSFIWRRMVRRKCAARWPRTPSTPAQANRHLADDADDEVRVELARKIGQLLPNLPQDASKRLRELTIETLERLARDALPRVRQVLAEEIKSLDCVPRRVIKALARDVEVVAAPILEYSPLLSDADLVDVITSAQASFALWPSPRGGRWAQRLGGHRSRARRARSRRPSCTIPARRSAIRRSTKSCGMPSAFAIGTFRSCCATICRSAQSADSRASSARP